MKATIQSVAEKAGVSTSTVSRVLNGKGKISSETKQRILQISEELGYRPRRYGKKHDNVATRNICLLSSGFHHLFRNAFYSQIVGGAERVLAQNGYQLIFKTVAGTGTEDIDTIDSLITGRQIQGMLLVGYEIDTSLIARIKEHGLPLVLVDNDSWEMNVNCVVNDNVSGARRIVDHLIELGHKHIGFVGGPLSHVSLDERYIGYKQALKQAGLAKDQDLIVFSSPLFGVEDGYRVAKEMLSRVRNTPGATMPTAMFAANDCLAIGTIKAAQDLGLRVPEDISVAGFDDDEMSKHVTPAVTTVRVHKQEMGIEAGKRLIEIINGEVTKPIKIVLSTETVIRKSTAKAPALEAR